MFILKSKYDKDMKDMHAKINKIEENNIIQSKKTLNLLEYSISYHFIKDSLCAIYNILKPRSSAYFLIPYHNSIINVHNVFICRINQNGDFLAIPISILTNDYVSNLMINEFVCIGIGAFGNTEYCADISYTSCDINYGCYILFNTGMDIVLNNSRFNNATVLYHTY